MSYWTNAGSKMKKIGGKEAQNANAAGWQENDELFLRLTFYLPVEQVKVMS